MLMHDKQFIWKHSYSKCMDVMCEFVNVNTKCLGKRRMAVTSEVTYQLHDVETNQMRQYLNSSEN